MVVEVLDTGPPTSPAQIRGHDPVEDRSITKVMSANSRLLGPGGVDCNHWPSYVALEAELARVIPFRARAVLWPSGRH